MSLPKEASERIITRVPNRRISHLLAALGQGGRKRRIKAAEDALIAEKRLVKAGRAGGLLDIAGGLQRKALSDIEALEPILLSLLTKSNCTGDTLFLDCSRKSLHGQVLRERLYVLLLQLDALQHALEPCVPGVVRDARRNVTQGSGADFAGPDLLQVLRGRASADAGTRLLARYGGLARNDALQRVLQSFGRRLLGHPNERVGPRVCLALAGQELAADQGVLGREPRRVKGDLIGKIKRMGLGVTEAGRQWAAVDASRICAAADERPETSGHCLPEISEPRKRLIGWSAALRAAACQTLVAAGGPEQPEAGAD